MIYGAFKQHGKLAQGLKQRVSKSVSAGGVL
jgi:hypothetical protein